MSVTIYHNPKCSKSRATLQLLEDNGVQAKVVEYLSDTPSATQLKDILKKLNLGPRDILRKKEAKEEGIASDLDGDALIKEMVAHPRAIERPIVINGDNARLGRPPEQVLEII